MADKIKTVYKESDKSGKMTVRSAARLLLFLSFLMGAILIVLEVIIGDGGETVNRFILIFSTVFILGFFTLSKWKLAKMHDFFGDIFSCRYFPAIKDLPEEEKREKVTALKEAIEDKYPAIGKVRHFMEIMIVFFPVLYFQLSHFNFEEIIVADIVDIALWMVLLIVFRVVVLNLLEGWIFYRLMIRMNSNG